MFKFNRLTALWSFALILSIGLVFIIIVLLRFLTEPPNQTFALLLTSTIVFLGQALTVTANALANGNKDDKVS